ncbi:MAG TPA: TolC family protein [Polyangiaceae bacterium]|nr:TolC family protein [Polyangiaceae bacterium]
MRLGSTRALLAVGLAGAALQFGSSVRAEDAVPAPSAKPSSPASTALGRTPVVVPKGASLARCLDLAAQNHPNVWAARARLHYMRGQLDEAHFVPFSEFHVTGGFGIAPTVRGNDLYSPNTEVSLSSTMGVAWRIGVEGVIPLWTFGKMTNLWNAAEAQVKVGENDVNKQRNQVKMDVRKAYFGLQLARDSIALLGDASNKLDKGIEHLEREVKAGNADEIDLLKLRTFRFEIEGRKAEARRYEAIAKASLQFLTGEGDTFDIEEGPLRPTKKPLLPVAQYLQAARVNRPEVNMVRAGLLAREAQVALAQSKYYPDLGIGVSAQWARAPLVTDQLNPFVRDDANYLRYGAALVFRWQLDFLPDAARVAQARAQVEELRATERFALGGIGVEVETAYAQVVDAVAREQAYGSAERTAKQWIIAVQQGIDVGTKEDSDLVDAARQWATQRFNHLTATMDLNVAWSNLALATAWDEIAPGGG